MGGACGTNGGEERFVQSFGGGTRRTEINWRTWEDNTKENFQVVVWGMDWIDLARDGERRRAVVNAVMNMQVE
jgi:hypothetical protein